MKINILLSGIVASSKTRVRCAYCRVYIPKASKCIEQHAYGFKHRISTELMTQNGIVLKQERLYCRLCKMDVLEEDSINMHISKERHSNWIATLNDLTEGEYIYVETYLSSESDNVHCDVCKVYLHGSLPSIEHHVNKFSHRSNVLEKLKPQNAIFCGDDEPDAWCKLCDLYIENTVPSLFEHTDDDDFHIDKLAQIEDVCEAHDISYEGYLKNKHEKYAYCKKCKIYILCKIDILEAHVFGEDHLKKFGL